MKAHTHTNILALRPTGQMLFAITTFASDTHTNIHMQAHVEAMCDALNGSNQIVSVRKLEWDDGNGDFDAFMIRTSIKNLHNGYISRVIKHNF